MQGLPHPCHASGLEEGRRAPNTSTLSKLRKIAVRIAEDMDLQVKESNHTVVLSIFTMFTLISIMYV